MSSTSTSQRFLFESSNVRGEHLSVTEQWQIILKQREYPEVVQKVLAEALACSILITSTLKFKGRLNLQIQSDDGQISLLVVQVKTDFTFRATADWKDTIGEYSLEKLFTNAHLLITLEREKNSYQAVVELSGETLTQCIEQYFLKSEQLETRLWVANDKNQLSGLLIQKLPEEDNDKTTWEHVTLMTNTIKDNELLAWDTHQLIKHLYPEDNVRLFDNQFWQFSCTCSQEKINNMVKSLGKQEAHSIIEEQGSVSVDCEFCHHHYQLDAIDVALLFNNSSETTKKIQ